MIPEQVIAGKIARDAIIFGKSLCKNEISAIELDSKIKDFILQNKAFPALSGYKPPFTDNIYNNTICISINNQAVHGVPRGVIKPTDLITIDLVVKYNNYYADSARTFSYADEHKDLISKIEKIYDAVTNLIYGNMHISLYSAMLMTLSNKLDLYPIKDFCGHGIGKEIHSAPQILSYPDNEYDKDYIFKIGSTYAIEPVWATNKNYKLFHENEWTISANCLTCHHEDTIFITNNGIVNLTK